MICSIDFGRSQIRSLALDTAGVRPLKYAQVSSTYLAFPETDVLRQALSSQQVSVLSCGDSLLVAGTDQAQVRDLCQQPPIPLFPGGRVPREEAAARQLLYLLTQTMLPEPERADDVCVLTVPTRSVGPDDEGTEFLERLIRMRGYQPRVLGAAEAAMLAESRQSLFSGVSAVVGAEASSVCVARHGLVYATNTHSVSGNAIDRRIAHQFSMNTWDAAGISYPDFERIREWRQGLSEEKGLLQNSQVAKLVEILSDSVAQLATSVLEAVADGMLELNPQETIPVVLAGGLSKTPRLTDLLADELSLQSGQRLRFHVRLADEPELAVVRGGLVYGMLDFRSNAMAAKRAA